jgi:hypothetical protein
MTAPWYFTRSTCDAFARNRSQGWGANLTILLGPLTEWFGADSGSIPGHRCFFVSRQFPVTEVKGLFFSISSHFVEDDTSWLYVHEDLAEHTNFNLTSFAIQLDA